MTDRRLARTLRFADHACRDAGLICQRHAKRALPGARELLEQASEAAFAGEQVASGVLASRRVARRVSRAFTRPMVGIWAWASSLAGEAFNIEMAAHVTRKLGLVLDLCAKLSEEQGAPSDARALAAAAERLNESHRELASEAASRRAGKSPKG